MKNKTIAFKIKPKAERAIKRGHPWIFEEAIEKQNKEGDEGDVAIIFNRKTNKVMGIGLYDPFSIIRIRLLAMGKSAKIGEEFFLAQFKKALAIREPLLQTETTGFRWIYGENDEFPGLILDVYADVAILKIYSSIWLPYVDVLLKCIENLYPINTVVLRMSRQLQQLPIINKYKLEDGQILKGAADFNGEVIFKEHGLKLSTNVIKGHKTGFFLDHRHNRLKVRSLSKGKSVLDIFSYSGGFSTSAFAGGATEVTALDISKGALTHAKKNVQLNTPEQELRTIQGDAFDELKRLNSEGESFDLIIADPPSFAKKVSEKEQAQAAYQRLFGLVLPLCNKGGTVLLASCSSRITEEEFEAMVEDSIAKDEGQWKIIEKSDHDIDHPKGIAELQYLKAMYLRRGE